MKWLEIPRKTSLRGRLTVISIFVLLYLIFRFSGYGRYLLGPLFSLALFYWVGKSFASWYMGRKSANRSLVTVVAWACLLGFFSFVAGSFAIGASYEFNRFRKDIPRTFALLPTAGLIVTILSAVVAIYAKKGRL
jgi:hypothetical protein